MAPTSIWDNVLQVKMLNAGLHQKSLWLMKEAERAGFCHLLAAVWTLILWHILLLIDQLLPQEHRSLPSPQVTSPVPQTPRALALGWVSWMVQHPLSHGRDPPCNQTATPWLRLAAHPSAALGALSGSSACPLSPSWEPMCQSGWECEIQIHIMNTRLSSVTLCLPLLSAIKC